jgi:hypothetical protein
MAEFRPRPAQINLCFMHQAIIIFAPMLQVYEAAARA